MGEGLLLHTGAIRMRVTGSGTLQSTLYSFDNVNSSTLPNITLASTTNREPTILANFTEQGAQLEVKTTLIDETFEISKIVIFTKPIAADFPR